jgi:hypothetical protein
VQQAVKALLLLPFLLTATTNTWSANGPSIRVEAMVGAAVVVFEDIDCPDDVTTVPTGEVAQTNPATCETIVALSTVSDAVGVVAWAIAAADPDDPEAKAAIDALLADLSVAEQVMLVTVLHNNQQHLGTNDATVVATVGQIISVSPEAAASVVLTATVLNPANADAIFAEAIAAAPGQGENIQQGQDVAEDIRQDFTENDQASSTEEESDGGSGQSEEVEVVEVISVTEPEPEAPPPPPETPVDPPIDSTVPPGGGLEGGDIPPGIDVITPTPPSPE